MSARVNQTRLDDVMMPVFCPTCQTNLPARPKLARQEDQPMTSKATSQQTSRNMAGAGPRSDGKPRSDKKPRSGNKPRRDKARDLQEAVIEDAGEPADSGRDLVHGDGGTIELPTRPGDLSKDD
ncbi:hypothetical protein [Bradyrhizobium centrosematis]|uniref:hypothetical protein n=1 Tax=Bradyrhizobium centrosematis TaxID=1300039 RepID=UPI0021682C7D|nr:hypothetical protein [Bradyrhizobium centrosematis]MCS3765211.1 hypothetical protein [Bradyrhizobium centrosematis]MCS3774090.1 hypothetical protein [Bradyrhizobium centrosematis]